jgi:hypothetical protein
MECVKVTDQEVIIQVTDFVALDGHVRFIQELYRTLHRLAHELETKTIRFIFSIDGEPFKMTGFERVAEYIATTYNIPKHRMILQTFDHCPMTDSPWVNVITKPSDCFQRVKQFIKLEKCVPKINAKLFGGFYGRLTPQRFLMAYFLETEMHDKSIVAFHPSIKWAEQNFTAVRSWYDKEFKWLLNRASQQVSKVIGGYNGRIDDYTALEDYHNIFGLCHIDVVLETNSYEMGWWTEKTVRCLYAGKPFILMGTHGQLEHLKTVGFKTFSPWINESYDQESNTDKRFDMVQEEIRRISSMSDDQLQKFLFEINAIAEHNKTNYDQIVDNYENKFNLSNIASYG